MTRALLLNASYEPHAIVTDRRMLRLYTADPVKVEPIEFSGRTMRGVNFSVLIPSVARLIHYVDVPNIRKSVMLTTRAVLARDGYECGYCGLTDLRPGNGGNGTMDHIHPRSAVYVDDMCAVTCGMANQPHRGPHTWENVTASCRACNSLKTNMSLAQMLAMGPDKPNVPGELGRWLERWTLHRRPFRPNGVTAYLLALRPEPEWLPWLGAGELVA